MQLPGLGAGAATAELLAVPNLMAAPDPVASAFGVVVSMTPEQVSMVSFAPTMRSEFSATFSRKTLTFSSQIS